MDAPWQGAPADGTTIWHLSDTHVNFEGVPVWSMPRLDAIAADMNDSPLCAGVHARLHTGDITEHGHTDQVTAAKTWLDANFPDVSDVVVYGNHDYGNGWAASAKNRPAVEADYARAAFTDATVGPVGGQVRLLGFSPFSVPISDDPVVRATWTLDQDALDWLEARLNEQTSVLTILACHYWLNETDSTSVKGSQPAAVLNDMIAAHPQVLAWACGHSHFQVTDPRVAQLLQCGDRAAFPQIQAPSPTLTSGVPYENAARYPYRSLFLTVRDADRVEVRYRDHGARQWVAGYQGQMVTVLNPS